MNGGGNSGGVFNPSNLMLFSYGFNNPIKYIDKDGKDNIIFYYSKSSQPEFKMAAQTEAKYSSIPSKLIPVRTESDFKNQWNKIANKTKLEVDKVSIYSHAGKKSLYFQKSTTDDGSLSTHEANSLKILNYKDGAQINLMGCNSGVIDKDENGKVKANIASTFAKRQGVITTGSTNYTSFSTNNQKRNFLQKIGVALGIGDERYLNAYNSNGRLKQRNIFIPDKQ